MNLSIRRQVCIEERIEGAPRWAPPLGGLPIPFTMTPETLLLVLGAGALMLFALARLVTPSRSAGASYRRKAVLSPWERKALGTLSVQLRPGMHLCPQVRLADMLSIEASDRSHHVRALNRVACKSVDFVVADVATGNPVLVIELDDKSHRREDRQARDALVNEVLREAGFDAAEIETLRREGAFGPDHEAER